MSTTPHTQLTIQTVFLSDDTLDQALLRDVPPAGRLLLLPHCLRPREGCAGKMTEGGLQCDPNCQNDCQIRPLRQAAERAGYGGICVAPGGRLAVRAVARMCPQAIIAVACDKELAEGVEAVAALPLEATPPIVQIPLLRDGCVDTLVDVERALALITV